jgi:hypothetical protein
MWRTIYKLPFTLTVNSNLKYFQYRLCHRIRQTNTFLQLIKVQDDNSCSFCGEEIEDLVHLCCKCKCVVPIWLRIEQWLHRSGFNNVCSFTCSDIILGRVDEYTSVNFVILIVKFAIYNCTLKGNIPHFAVRYLSVIM